ncbi:flagellar hook assembly protein FlgD [Clostridium thermopalmarium]|uniref:Basal-body rod modification protein FlgD n=1 Tax=Clostridium thermopalmarium DSM 5974 TaxID=1121340 RepID=A0A2T0AX07_9CLOT|nr:flagellar hook capping FlgD N-terminal domain-containing protein [Clostridium thermopalmarium]PRR75127.1 flagellar basal body rod modification protein [Clostridium thermopalmarium DSM 5974]PVZ27883.1 flagellar basal-body rod modification protein FlgD [Clostridium thermopalmarium DSM 5974]
MIDPVLSSQTATERGTKIVKKGQEMDKNAFLKILTAELTNQDPMNAKDSTAYVSQLAQFTSLEQMTNLNNTMSFNSATNLVGKTVALDVYDGNGRQYGGTVVNVARDGDEINLTVKVGKYEGDKLIGYEEKKFSFNDVSEVLDIGDYKSEMLLYLIDNISYTNSNMNFMLASNLVNKQVELSVKSGDTTENYSGTVIEAFRTSDGIKLKVRLEDSGEEKEFYYNDVVKVKE